MKNKILHLRSSVVVDNKPKLPSKEQLEYGELAINYAKDNETISFKNTSNELVEVKTKNYYDKQFENKANTTGYYEDLEVGLADNLIGRDIATEREFVFSASGGEGKSIQDGTARITSIQGNSLVWNQFVQYSITHGTKYLTTKNSDNSYVVKLNPNFDKDSGSTYFSDWFGKKVINGHKYYAYFRYKVSGLSENAFAEVNIYNVSNTTQHGKRGITNGTGSHSVIFTSDYTNTNTGTFSPYIPLSETNAEITIYGDRKFIDLTQMFGAGNEPTTIEEFNARCPQNVSWEYNEGTIINNNTTAIKSTGFNAWDEEWELGSINNNGILSVDNAIISKNYNRILPNTEYYLCYNGDISQIPNMVQIGYWDREKNFIGREFVTNKAFTTPSNAYFFKVATNFGATITTYNHDICINLSHTGYRNGEYKPYETFTRQLPTVEGGLKSAGNVADEIRYNTTTRKWEHIKRVGSVDLGTLSWEKYISPNAFWSGKVVNCVVAEYSLLPNFTSIFKNGNQYKINNGAANGISENLVGIHDVRARIMFYSPSFEATDEGAAALKQSLQGVILNYELAEPVITELDYDRGDIEYQVWDFGTEEAIQEVPSTLFKSSIKYGFNAVDTIRWNEIEIENLKDEISELETDMKDIEINGGEY